MIKHILKYKNIIFLLVCTLSIFLYLNYHQVYANKIYGESYKSQLKSFNSDTIPHIESLKKFFNGDLYIPHPLWHISVKIISACTSLSIENSAIIFSSLILIFWVFLIYLLVKKSLSSYYPSMENLYMIITVMIIVIGPLTLPFNIIFLGQGSPNIWHNITLWTVKPFGLLTIILTIKALASNKLKYYIYAILFAIVSLFAKPNFILVFIPSLLVLIITKKIFSKSSLLFLGILILLIISLLYYQMINTFTTDSSIILDFTGVWSLYTKNIALSILLALAFPISFTLMYPKSLQVDTIYLAWLQIFFGIILFMFFAETGVRYTHGNFGWSYMIALSFIYLFTIIEFIRVFKTLSQWKKVLLLTLLIYQSFVGLYYLYKISEGYQPLYIRLLL